MQDDNEKYMNRKPEPYGIECVQNHMVLSPSSLTVRLSYMIPNGDYLI